MSLTSVLLRSLLRSSAFNSHDCFCDRIQIRDRRAQGHGVRRAGDAIRAYLKTLDLNLRLVALPAYSPDLNADEAIWDWMRDEVTANTCFGSAAKVREKLDAFFAGLLERAAEVQQPCRTELQAQADAVMATVDQLSAQTKHVDLTLRSV